MTTISVELKTKCNGCGENIPINAVVETVWCSRCRQPARLDLATWKKILEAPALDGPRAEPGKHDVSVLEIGRPLVRDFARNEASCARCGAGIPLPAALDHAARGWSACVQCGDRLSVRPLPPAFAGLGGVTHLVGEDFAQLAATGPAGPAATGSTTVPCSACGGVLSVDALSLRSSSCKYCGAGVVVPDAVWERMHPSPTQRAWYIRHEPAATATGEGVASFRWDTLDTAVADAGGNLYMLAKHRLLGRTPVASSCDAGFRRRWMRDDVPDGHTDRALGLAVTVDGHLLKWGAGLHGLLKLSCADGSTVATLGGQAPVDATAHHLDMQDCDELVADIDGTLLGFIDDRILRWAPDGAPIETWAPTKTFFGGLRRQKLVPLSVPVEDPPALGELKDRPTTMRAGDGTFAVMDRGGALHVADGKVVRKFARDGTRAWCVTLPERARCRPGIDARGHVYVLLALQDDARCVYRISPDGTEVKLLIDGGQPGTPICADRCLLVLPDGTLLVLADGGSARVFAPDGAARFASDGARRRDAERARRRAEDAR